MNNELTAALLTIEKCRELSGCPAGVDLQDWVKMLAAENVELKQSERELDKTCAEEFGQDWVSEFTETPATDRIVAEAEARGVEKFAAHLRANDNGASVCKMIALGADDFAKHLREGAK
ncbi:hypothetical protein L7H29_004345 [Klebsiella pneumoniae]|uniref:hypothetical protein n=1 Tax=Klebsiella pneumoniae TaxID=573 RepID=UPI002730D1C6|nr:hypothetical protein [Klebsiella pneumoniae]EKU2609821.1 hypothetical protein [Klebsiella pneumoniae]EKU3918078.1 hypothetical protein [Klebsiella pneumoniae]EKU3934666.1 hypothetical protein [Klebsiella pneumoniae]EKX7974577.1 hypothetical protein [Klebsiella pneumoniae]EKX9089309.1 hypothetical protein [Klebsiella pneumoniae]